jgi:hypothetical protein
MKPIGHFSGKDIETQYNDRSAFMTRNKSVASDTDMALKTITFGQRHRSINYRLNPMVSIGMNKTSTTSFKNDPSGCNLPGKPRAFPTVGSKVGMYIGGYTSSVKSGVAPRTLAMLRTARTAEEMQGDMAI